MGPGDVIGGKYEVVRFLGKGGMGMVLEARHKKLDQRVAIKVLLPEALERPDAVARFEREARAAAKLKSVHVARVIDVDNDAERGGLPFIVMEYLEGHDVQHELRRREKIPVTEAVDWIVQACIAMAEAHANGIVHRDLKPSNLFLVPAARGATVKVMDFGISKLVATPGETDLTTTETTLGTPSYMAPEQLMSAKTIDHRADIWALGVVTYRLLSGRLPFVADSAAALAVAIVTTPPAPLAAIAPHVPPPLAAAIARAMERDPMLRQEDAVALGRMLLPFGSGSVPFEASIAALPPPRARAASDPQLTAGALASADATMRDNPPTENAWSHRGTPAQPSSGRSPALPIAIAAVVGTLALGGAAASWWMVRRSPPPAPIVHAAASSAPATDPAPSPASESETGPIPAPPPTAVTVDDPMPSSSVALHPPPRPAKSTGAPARSSQRRKESDPAPPAKPEKDPLHL